MHGMIQADKGSLSIDAVAQDGAFIVDNISFYQDAKLATEVTAEADWLRRGLYIGPQVLNINLLAAKFLFKPSSHSFAVRPSGCRGPGAL